MKAFDKELKIPVNSDGMLRYVHSDQKTIEKDMRLIGYGCQKNFSFYDTLTFLKFCTESENDHYALLQSNTSGKLYMMNDDDFQELLLDGTFHAKTHTVTGSFYFIRKDGNRFSIVKAPPENAQQEYQTHQKLMRETRPHALNMLENAVGEHADDVWDNIASDVVKKLMKMRQPIRLNGWTEIALKNAIGEQIMEIINPEKEA